MNSNDDLHFLNSCCPDVFSRKCGEFLTFSLSNFWELSEDLDLHLVLAPLFTDPVAPRPLVPSPPVMKMIQACQTTVNVFLLFGIDKVG